MSRKTHYVALIKKVGMNYGVEFPDFPNVICVLENEKLEEVINIATQTLALYVEKVWKDGDSLPLVSMTFSDNISDDVIPVLIKVDVSKFTFWKGIWASHNRSAMEQR